MKSEIKIQTKSQNQVQTQIQTQNNYIDLSVFRFYPFTISLFQISVFASL